MLCENLTHEDLDIVISETTKIPDFLNVNISLKFQRFSKFSEVSWRSFWIKNEEGKRVDFVSRELLVPEYVLLKLFNNHINEFPDLKVS